MLPDTMDTTNDSFFLDAISDEAAQSLADGCEDSHASRDIARTDLQNTDPNAGLSDEIAESTQSPARPQEPNVPPQSMLIFIMGEHRFSDSCELGVLNEHPEALKSITSNPCLSTSTFLNPALHAVLAELRPRMMVQVAVRLTAISLRLVAQTLPNEHILFQDEGTGGDEQQRLSQTVRRELKQAVPHYQWQGPRNRYGRVQYLMALLQEAIRVLAVPTESLTDALKMDEPATRVFERVAQSIAELGQSPADVCGVWAAETVLSAWPLKKARFKSSGDRTVASRSAVAEPESADDEPKTFKSSRCMTPDSEPENELPSPSRFIKRKPSAKMDNEVANSGSRADNPMCVSDSEAEKKLPLPSKFEMKISDPKAPRSSCRGEVLKGVSYSTRHHPQDEEIPGFRRRRKMQSEDDNVGARTSSAKRGKIIK